MEIKEFTKKDLETISRHFEVEEQGIICGGVMDVEQSKLDAMKMTLDEYFDHKRNFLIDTLCLNLKKTLPKAKFSDKYFINKEVGKEKSKVEIFLSISTPKA